MYCICNIQTSICCVYSYPQAAQDEARRYGEVCSSSDSVNYTTPVAEIAGRGLDEV